MEATTDQYKRLSNALMEGWVTMLIVLAATTAVMQLLTIFVPIVHKESLYKAGFMKKHQ